MMPFKPIIVAVEGGCNYGKSTLVKSLARLLPREAGVAPDYAEDAGNLPRSFFSLARNTQARLGVVQFFADIDARRSKYFIPGGEVCLFDRSIHTLMAHSFAEEAICGYDALTPTIEYLESRSDIYWPVIVVSIEIEPELLKDRRRTRMPPGILADQEFDKYFRGYFHQKPLPRSPHLIHCSAPFDDRQVKCIVDRIRQEAHAI